MKHFTTIKSSILFLILVLGVSLLQAQDDDQKDPVDAGAIAKELANPNNTLGQMALQWDYVNYQGNLPNSGSQNGYVMNFQPSLPVPLGKGVISPFIYPNQYLAPMDSRIKALILVILVLISL